MDRASLILLSLVLALFATSASAVDFGDIQIRAPATIDARIDRGVWTMNRAPSYPYTAVELRGMHNMQIAGNQLAVNSTRALSAAKLAQLSRGLARNLGPAGLAFTLAGLVWDAAQNKWIKDPSGSSVGGCPTSCDSAGALCTRGGVQGQTVIVQRTSCSSSPLMSGDVVINNCTNMPSDNCGYFPMLVFRPASNLNPNPYLPSEATDAELEQAISEQLSDLTKALAQANLIAQSLGRLGDLLDAADPISATDGPATAPKVTESTSETGPEGTTVTTTETTPQIQYSTTTNIIKITTTIITIIQYPDGRTEEKTRVEESDKPKEEDEDFCKKNPTSILCRELGDLEAPDLPEEELDLEWNKERSASGSCPAPITASYYGQSITVDWDFVCQFAEGVRPMTILVSSLLAGIWIFGVFKEQ